jgi:hypothetical protein
MAKSGEKIEEKRALMAEKWALISENVSPWTAKLA